jgi:hydrogenase expression/formation protein HypC
MCLAVPGQVLSIADDQLRTATISFGGTMKEVSLALVPEADVGDYVIVHVGFAISRLDEEAARRSLELFAILAKKETVTRLTVTPSPDGYS